MGPSRITEGHLFYVGGQGGYWTFLHKNEMQECQTQPNPRTSMATVLNISSHHLVRLCFQSTLPICFVVSHLVKRFGEFLPCACPKELGPLLAILKVPGICSIWHQVLASVIVKGEPSLTTQYYFFSWMSRPPPSRIKGNSLRLGRFLGSVNIHICKTLIPLFSWKCRCKTSSACTRQC